MRIAGSLNIDTSIQTNDNIIDLSPLNSIEIVDGILSIYRLSNLNEISMNVTEVGILVIESENAESINFQTLSQTTLGGLQIANSSELSTFNFPSLTSIKKELQIFNNPNLENLNGFQNLTSIGLGSDIENRLIIGSNSSLSNIHGLTNVSSQIRFLSLEANNSLQSLNGLENLLLKDIEILGNTNLNDYCAIANFISNGTTYDGENYEDGSNLTILGNLYNPILQNFIDGECND